MKESSEIEPINYGPAAITMDAGEKGMEVLFSTIMTGEDVKNAPLQISEVEEHWCSYDEDLGKATRMVSGKVQEVNTEKMKKIAHDRRISGRSIKIRNNKTSEKESMDK